MCLLVEELSLEGMYDLLVVVGLWIVLVEGGILDVVVGSLWLVLGALVSCE